MLKNFHPVYATKIQTHDLSDMSRHPKPLDKGDNSKSH